MKKETMIKLLDVLQDQNITVPEENTSRETIDPPKKPTFMALFGLIVFAIFVLAFK